MPYDAELTTEDRILLWSLFIDHTERQIAYERQKIVRATEKIERLKLMGAYTHNTRLPNHIRQRHQASIDKLLELREERDKLRISDILDKFNLHKGSYIAMGLLR